MVLAPLSAEATVKPAARPNITAITATPRHDQFIPGIRNYRVIVASFGNIGTGTCPLSADCQDSEQWFRICKDGIKG